MNQALYQVTASGAQPTVTGLVLATNALTFHYAANGMDVVKTFRFDSSYVVTVETEVKRNGAPVRALIPWPAGLGDMEEFLVRDRSARRCARPRSSPGRWTASRTRQLAPKVSDNATLDQPYQYAAITDLYFVSAFLPDAPERATVVTLHNTIDLPGDPERPQQREEAGARARPGRGRHQRLHPPAPLCRTQGDGRADVHPRHGADGKPDGQSLEPLIQFGWLTVIAKPLYLALRFLDEHGVGNWGWAIIIVTVIFNLLMLPTRFMMMKSSLKMMRIQPKVDAIKKRYAHLKATDPKRAEMNAEMMELYKTEGVNMYGSCLPMLVQMPLFFAYYRVLLNAVELRQAHWFWLTDLSAPDPLHILPILIIVTMFLTQYITPSPGMDPAQRRMMAFMMPVIFGFIAVALRLRPGALLGHRQHHQPGHADRHQPIQHAARRCTPSPPSAPPKSRRNPKTIQGKR